MKSILLIRHAKSDWSFNVPDFDRPLNKRGHSNAPDMAKRILQKGIKIDAFISSSAKRAYTTACYFAEIYQHPVSHIIQIPSLYHAPPQVFSEIIGLTNNNHHSIALFAHNPGITAFANELGVASIDHMPTCSIFALDAICNQWQDFAKAEKSFCFFDYPKNG
jgi:phosphohistidine phosphatase